MLARLVLVSSLAATLPGASALAAESDPKLTDLRGRWLNIMQQIGVPGAAVVVVRGDEVILLEPLGIRNIESSEPVTPDTIFYIASCTKSFMAMAVLSLVDEGKIDLNAPVKKYLPQFQIADPQLSESLTIRDLLSHAKGLDGGNITFGEAYSGEMTDERYWRMMTKAQAEGTFRYTNLHYTLLGRVVEKVTGKKWQDFVEERVCRPAGMNRTTAYASRMYGDADAAIPTIYWDKQMIVAPVRKTDRTMHAAGGMGSTANDLGRWMRLNLNGGTIDGKQIISGKMIEQMQTIQADHPRRGTPVPVLFRSGYGFGWEVGTYRDRKMIQHGGGYVGAAALVTMLPEEKIGVAVLVNTDGPGSGFMAVATADVIDRLLGIDPPLDLIDELRPRYEQFIQRRAEQAATTTRPVDADALSLPIEAYAGAYKNDDLGTLHVKPENGRLVMQIGDLHPRIFANEKDSFLIIFAGGNLDGGRFEIDSGKVKAVVIRSGDDEDRFVRE